MKRILKLLYPDVCPVCKQLMAVPDMPCDKCGDFIEIIKEPKCEKCGKQLKSSGLQCEDCQRTKHFFVKNFSLFTYKDRMREVIANFKYENERYCANYFANTAYELYGKEIKAISIDAIIPVPMYRHKEIKRGYNGANIFAKALGKKLHINVDDKCLIRIKNTMPQKKLTRSGRQEHLSDAFAIDKKRVSKYKNILIVDDIFTTGSTMDACASILIEGGAKKIYSMSIAVGAQK